MKRTFFAILFFVFTLTVNAQNLKNPRLETTGGSTWSSGNYLLFIDPSTYIKKSDIEISDLKNLLREWKEEKIKNSAQERLLNEQKKEIDELKKLISTLQRQLEEEKRKIEDLQRKVK